MRLVAGIDAGQSSTTAVIVDQDGVVRGRGTAGPAAHVEEPAGSTKCADACTTALMRALDAAKLSHATRFEAVHVGLSGYDGHFDGARPEFAADHVSIGHDAPIALAGAVPSRPAVVVIAGTGSVVYGEDGAGASVRVGGWGYLFGDEGSAFAVARDALAHAMHEQDRGLSSPLGDAALAFFDRHDLRDLATAAVLGRIPRDKIAWFGRVVHDAARLSDRDAAAIADAAAGALARLTAVALARLHLSERAVQVALCGGAFNSETFLARTRERLAVIAPNAMVVTPRYGAAVGAALVAFGDADLAVPVRVVEA
jgi:N-acetylglucosamine kinase-like BadF-type ATPase